METRDNRQIRQIATEFKTRDDGGKLYIEGYFAVFNSIYDMGYGMSEMIAPEAFDKTLGGDIRALINHDTTLVLGRTKAGTLELRVDSHGLFGSIEINPKDQDAMNLYARVQRGDVDQCSFGFEIIREDTEFLNGGDDIRWTIREVELYEVSCCTFPAYKETSIKARADQKAELLERRNQAWKETMLKRVKGDTNGTQNTDAQEAD